MFPKAINPSSTLGNLRRQWAAFAVLSLSFLAGGYALLSLAWQPDLAACWLILPSAVMAYLLVVLWRNLDANHRPGESWLLPAFGWGNALTLLRGTLVAALAGFLFLPRPEGWLAWAPGILYTLSDAADFFDGYVARITRHATRLGEVLDMSFDGLGVLIASTLAVQYGQVPVWYLAVGLARPIFLAGMWLRNRLGKPNYELPPGLSRRVFAGLQMGFLAVVLWPLFSPPGTHIAAALFGLPLLAGFFLDWLAVSGVFQPGSRTSREQKTFLIRWLPVLLRLGILVLGLGLFFGARQTSSGQAAAMPLLAVLHALAISLIVFGIVARTSAILALCILGFYQMLASLAPVQIALAVAYTAILYLGSGAFSLWAPEDQLVYRRAGEPRKADAEQVP
jgi:CDP-diacylglycerol--glycerol-3-phosphate 3-phosphatidyltransferase